MTVVGLAEKLLIVGEGPVGTFVGVKIVPVCTTSKLEGVICFSRFRSLLFQRLSGTPLMKILLPLSARIKPYFFLAFFITCSSAGLLDLWKLAVWRCGRLLDGAFGRV